MSEQSFSARSVIRAQIRRDMRVAFRGGGGWFHTVFFFAIFAGLSGFALGPEPANLRMAASAVCWLGIVVALQFATTELFKGDFEDGTLQVLGAEHASLGPYVVAKMLALMVTTGLPMLVLTPVMFLTFSVPPGSALTASLIIGIGVPGLILACIVAAALSAGLRTGGLLGAGIASPLLIPMLIFGIGATDKVIDGISEGGIFSGDLLLLIALALFYAVVLPPFAILALRLGLE